MSNKSKRTLKLKLQVPAVQSSTATNGRLGGSVVVLDSGAHSAPERGSASQYMPKGKQTQRKQQQNRRPSTSAVENFLESRNSKQEKPTEKPVINPQFLLHSGVVANLGVQEDKSCNRRQSHSSTAQMNFSTLAKFDNESKKSDYAVFKNSEPEEDFSVVRRGRRQKSIIDRLKADSADVSARPKTTSSSNVKTTDHARKSALENENLLTMRDMVSKTGWFTTLLDSNSEESIRLRSSVEQSLNKFKVAKKEEQERLAKRQRYMKKMGQNHAASSSFDEEDNEEQQLAVKQDPSSNAGKATSQVPNKPTSQDASAKPQVELAASPSRKAPRQPKILKAYVRSGNNLLPRPELPWEPDPDQMIVSSTQSRVFEQPAGHEIIACGGSAPSVVPPLVLSQAQAISEATMLPDEFNHMQKTEKDGDNGVTVDAQSSIDMTNIPELSHRGSELISDPGELTRRSLRSARGLNKAVHNLRRLKNSNPIAANAMLEVIEGRVQDCIQQRQAVRSTMLSQDSRPSTASVVDDVRRRPKNLSAMAIARENRIARNKVVEVVRRERVLKARAFRSNKNNLQNQIERENQEINDLQNKIIQGFQSWLMYCAVASRSNLFHQKLEYSRWFRAEHQHLVDAATMIQRRYRRYRMSKQLFTMGRDIRILRRAMWKSVFNWRIRFKRQKCTIIREFLDHVVNSQAIIKAMKSYKLRVTRCQNYVRSFIQATKMRKALMLRQIELYLANGLKGLERHSIKSQGLSLVAAPSLQYTNVDAYMEQMEAATKKKTDHGHQKSSNHKGSRKSDNRGVQISSNTSSLKSSTAQRMTTSSSSGAHGSLANSTKPQASSKKPAVVVGPRGYSNVKARGELVKAANVSKQVAEQFQGSNGVVSLTDVLNRPALTIMAATSDATATSGASNQIDEATTPAPKNRLRQAAANVITQLSAIEVFKNTRTKLDTPLVKGKLPKGLKAPDLEVSLQDLFRAGQGDMLISKKQKELEVKAFKDKQYEEILLLLDEFLLARRKSYIKAQQNFRQKIEQSKSDLEMLQMFKTMFKGTTSTEVILSQLPVQFHALVPYIHSTELPPGPVPPYLSNLMSHQQVRDMVEEASLRAHTFIAEYRKQRQAELDQKLQGLSHRRPNRQDSFAPGSGNEDISSEVTAGNLHQNWQQKADGDTIAQSPESLSRPYVTSRQIMDGENAQGAEDQIMPSPRPSSGIASSQSPPSSPQALLPSKPVGRGAKLWGVARHRIRREASGKSISNHQIVGVQSSPSPSQTSRAPSRFSKAAGSVSASRAGSPSSSGSRELPVEIISKDEAISFARDAMLAKLNRWRELQKSIIDIQNESAVL